MMKRMRISSTSSSGNRTSSMRAFLSLLLLAASSASAFVVNSNAGAFFFQRTSSMSATSLSMSAALIVQNKGGGHGELGYQLAKALKGNYNDKITSITILQDDACKDSAEPFCSYATDLPDVKVVKASLSSEEAESMTAEKLQALLGGDAVTFDYVWDNASKGPTGAGGAICDLCAAWKVKLLVYVSSAGIYTPPASGPFPMPETTTTKATAGQVLFEQHALDMKLPLVTFRPQYIYGPNSNKHDYIDWYFDRLVRNLPLPIPGDGTQKVSLTNAQDVASLLASPLNNEQAAIEQCFFNCGTDQLHSYDEVAYLCAKAVGMDKSKVAIEHYDADMFGKAKFPFRMTDFYVAPDMAKSKLGWSGASHDLASDLEWYYENYKARGGPEKKLSLVKDWEIVVGSKTSPPEMVSSIYEQYDPLVIDTSNVQK